MEPLMAYGGNKLLNFVIGKVYNSPHHRFVGRGRAAGFDYTYKVVSVPVGRLIPNAGVSNLKIDLKVEITVKGNGIDFEKTIPMEATANIGMANGQLSITQLNVRNTALDIVDAVVTGVINIHVIPQLEDKLKQMPVPQLNDLFGSGLSARVFSGSVIDGPALELGSRLIGRTGLAAANRPTAATLQSLNNGNDVKAVAVISDEAANELLKSILTGKTLEFDESESAAIFSGRIKGEIRATRPTFDISGGVGTIQTTISIRNLKAGFKTQVTDWKWFRVATSTTATAKISNTLSIDGNKAKITLTGVEVFKIELDFPAALSRVKDLLEGFLEIVFREFRNKINEAVEGKTVAAFQLRENVFGDDLDLNVSFEPNGLSYFNHSIQAIFKIS